MNRNRSLGVACMLFAVVSAMFAMFGQSIGAAGFAVASGLAGLLAGWRHYGD